MARLAKVTGVRKLPDYEITEKIVPIEESSSLIERMKKSGWQTVWVSRTFEGELAPTLENS